MPFHIRHGAPGSYKSACAVWLDCLEFLKQGRVVHTNIRGIGDVADFENAFSLELPDTAEVVRYDLRTRADKLKFAAWFHWLPLGDAIIIDEGQMIYPNRRDFKPESLDLSDDDNPVNPETGERERPSDIFQAIDMHRHYNWDGCVTTPHIKKLPDWFRSAVERAYRHDNRSHIPFQKGKTRIISHAPDMPVPAISKGVSVKTLRVPKNVFEVYGSTTTGEITKNVSRTNPLRSPALILPALVGILGVGYFLFSLSSVLSPDPVSVVDSSPRSDASVDPVPGRLAQQDVARVSPSVTSPVDASASAYEVLQRHMPGATGLFVVGSWGPSGGDLSYLYSLVTDDRAVLVPGTWLSDAGFSLDVVSSCAHDLSHPLASSSLRVVCEPVARAERSEASGAQLAPPVGSPELSSIIPLGYSSY